eukprot:CAMPEP_0113683492 /NCGR_PEP_ID=MMETSP0038_2-20120614/13346_1 /TAXON_ID=2898 /ORGANISM="Cryptomonas paramecium" /LENGTH=232 /DNA_ID=CAMNT_0000602873 /DNA_START=9 /DNA_END=704 /DNA_ORIENTATION=- /assembly_acc=CAM_ASM_000170
MTLMHAVYLPNPSSQTQMPAENRMRIARICVASSLALTLVIGLVGYVNHVSDSVSLDIGGRFPSGIPMYRDVAPAVWSKSAFPRPGKIDTGRQKMSSEEAAVIERLRNDEKLLEGIISQSKLLSQEKSLKESIDAHHSDELKVQHKKSDTLGAPTTELVNKNTDHSAAQHKSKAKLSERASKEEQATLEEADEISSAGTWKADQRNFQAGEQQAKRQEAAWKARLAAERRAS